ncbi:tripartite tricarboxylate transporter substrate-binding protein [Devosia sp. MC521]|uniref:Bug family tripartite tricarboxylate transporter substrate binding protein n=1 Tax=Devosia sp. MC521 TaxID=2759954 RepID=UPI0015FB1554|nr:tripartite tricarboxylate transporter substrate-binding protein [Devosia sp. MC521]MBJ6989110.1 tripartite tricarboxylate transporter substrate binding protein [Devosia sp. MC521]QMW63311.1 tripartite tricarboxylate transporter substrate binding protein [Devosia sp. MC521]
MLKTLTALSLAAVFALPTAAFAQFPDRPIKLIVPFAAGGGSDTVARIYAPELAKALGQNVVVENIAGAGGSVGAAAGAAATPDGYTLLMATPSTQITGPLLQSNLPYDPDTAFEVLGTIFDSPNLLVVPADSPFQSIEDLVAAAKDAPGDMTYASPGVGSSAHMASELFKLMTDVEVEHIPYKGTGESLPDVIAGRVDWSIDSMTSMLAYVRTGELRALGVSSLASDPLVPEIAPIADVVEGFSATAVNYFVAPAATPQDVVARLREAHNEAVNSPELEKRLNDLGITLVRMTPDELDAKITNDRAKWGEVIEKAGIPVQ